MFVLILAVVLSANVEQQRSFCVSAPFATVVDYILDNKDAVSNASLWIVSDRKDSMVRVTRHTARGTFDLILSEQVQRSDKVAYYETRLLKCLQGGVTSQRTLAAISEVRPGVCRITIRISAQVSGLTNIATSAGVISSLKSLQRFLESKFGRVEL